MKRIRNCVIIVSVLIPILGISQEIDNGLSFKNICTDKYFRLNYENDFFSATDIYYTQGVNIEVVSPELKGFFLNNLLFSNKNGIIKYGMAVEHNGYTPTSIGSDTILNNDRPFAACLMLKTFKISIDTIRLKRVSSSIYTGIIGQAAFGAEMQTGIHKWLNNVRPQGWPNQIHNDAIINYQVDYEKQVYSYSKILSIEADASARIGTLNNKTGIGGTVIFGYFDDPFKKQSASKKNFRMYAYEHFLINLVGYNATMQGGLFDKSSPYKISSSDIDRIILENRFGFVVIYKNIYLEYFQSYQSQEFKPGNYHVWGGVQIAFNL